MRRIIRRIVVLGGDPTGLLGAIGLRRRLPWIAVTLVRSSSLGVIA